MLISSVHANTGVAGCAATKGALLSLTRQLAVDYAPHVRVNAVVPDPHRGLGRHRPGRPGRHRGRDRWLFLRIQTDEGITGWGEPVVEGRAETVRAAVTDPASITRAAEQLTAARPGLNVLINNAGIMLRENLLDPASLPITEDHVTTNLLGTTRMTYAFLPHLTTRGDAVVMNVTSALAFVPLPVTPTSATGFPRTARSRRA